MKPLVVVAAAIIEHEDRLLITRRPKGVHLEGHWEFPGGKQAPGETIAECLARELREELNVAATVGEPVLKTRHEYADRVVELHFLHCRIEGAPTPMEGQDMQWARREELTGLRFPPADEELISRLTRRT